MYHGSYYHEGIDGAPGWSSDIRHLIGETLVKVEESKSYWSRLKRKVYFEFWKLFLQKRRCRKQPLSDKFKYFPVDGSAPYYLGNASDEEVFEFERAWFEKRRCFRERKRYVTEGQISPINWSHYPKSYGREFRVSEEMSRFNYSVLTSPSGDSSGTPNPRASYFSFIPNEGE